MPYARTQIEAATNALEHAIAFDRPADTVLHDYFHANRALGNRERAFVADTVYGVLRRLRTIEHLAGGRRPRPMVLVWLARYAGASVRDLASVLGTDEISWLAAVKAASLEGLSPPVMLELPDWIVESLHGQTAESELVALARGFFESAPLDLRVNTLLAKRDQVLRELESDGIPAVPTPYSPVGVRVQGRPSINQIGRAHV